MSGTDSPCECGRQYVQLRAKDNGRAVIGCPRFPRSWRNLWVGGLAHSAKANAAEDYEGLVVSLVWR